MKLVLDTSVLVDHLRGDPRARDLLVGAIERGDELWSVTVVRTEVLAGVRGGEEPETLDLLGGIRWQDVTVEVADLAGTFARRYLRSHPGVDLADYLIGATTEILQAELKTLNVRHFPMFPGLAPAYA